MMAFTDLETAALSAIFDEVPDIAAALEEQRKSASVKERENTGGGFITTMLVAEDVPKVSGFAVLGYEVNANIEGMNHGLGFALILKDGRLHALDGHSRGAENTAKLDFSEVAFTITRGD